MLLLASLDRGREQGFGFLLCETRGGSRLLLGLFVLNLSKYYELLDTVLERQAAEALCDARVSSLLRTWRTSSARARRSPSSSTPSSTSSCTTTTREALAAAAVEKLDHAPPHLPVAHQLRLPRRRIHSLTLLFRIPRRLRRRLPSPHEQRRLQSHPAHPLSRRLTRHLRRGS